MRRRDIIICGVVKNVKNRIDHNIKLCRELGNRCDSYKIIIYENNSNDGTKEILEKYNNDPDCKIIMENLDIGKHNSEIWAYTKITGSDHPCRIEQISNARNKLINEITKDIYDSYTIVVNIDLDSSFWDVNGIIDSIDKVGNDRNTIIYANSTVYYDYYALRSSHSKYHLLGPEVIGEVFWDNLNKEKLRLDPEKNELVPVYSAFNGIGVFDKNIYKKYRYNFLVDNHIKTFYNEVFTTHPTLLQEFKQHVEKQCDKFLGGVEEIGIHKIYYKNNSGYDKPVICEHVSFNFNLHLEGYKIYINPKMLYWV